jgi:hypothetical protein
MKQTHNLPIHRGISYVTLTLMTQCCFHFNAEMLKAVLAAESDESDEVDFNWNWFGISK